LSLQGKYAINNQADEGWESRIGPNPQSTFTGGSIMSYSEIIINGSPIKLIPLGFCTCGCGGRTKVALKTDKSKRWIKGEALIGFIKGHNARLAGNKNPSWKGGSGLCAYGYRHVYAPDHPRCQANSRIREHILIAEKALGYFLPLGAVVHHVNGSKNNGPLVICQDDSYHKLLHQRMRAYKACGHASWRKCWVCKNYDDPENLKIYKKSVAHHDCDKQRRIKTLGIL